jgi:hypothetical protein
MVRRRSEKKAKARVRNNEISKSIDVGVIMVLTSQAHCETKLAIEDQKCDD